MGNSLGGGNSNVNSAVKAQAAGSGKGQAMYELISTTGGGELVELITEARKIKDYTRLQERIVEAIGPFLYNEGKGKIVPVSEIVERRCLEKGIVLSRNKEENDNEGFENEEDMPNEKGVAYKELCWRLDMVGAVGETCLHTCLLKATSIHADLLKWILKAYPKLINDIFLGDEYYGENLLHMAIVNEDPAMVKFLLDKGADVNQRCCGNFFTADDQKSKRKDNLNHEWFDLPVESNYQGYTYWGEYALGFAACLGQEECVRLLVARGADPNMQDSNGNTVLHMLVVHDRKMREMTAAHRSYSHPEDIFDLILDLKGKLHITNRQGLTPLTLAAKLARKEIYEFILERERTIAWVHGNVTCATYPLGHIDTIGPDGEINTNSAIYHIVYGDESEHLSMIDGVISNILDKKWKSFARLRFLRRFLMFGMFFCVFLVATYLRPGTDNYPETRTETRYRVNDEPYIVNITVKDPCYLLRARDAREIVRLIMEAIVLFGATTYLFLALKEVYHQGYSIFFTTLSASPGKVMFLIANCFVILALPGRAACEFVYEDYICTLAILFMAPYFLFFARGFKMVGPFVIMIYKMVKTDLIRFFIIYLIFVIGFSQAIYILQRKVQYSVFNNPGEAIMIMFVMSLGEFGGTYESFENAQFSALLKIIFLVYMVVVSLLLVNMLIAMMGNTYQAVAETQGEWLRQWAKIILVVEQTVTTTERKRKQMMYSQPTAEGCGRALEIRWHLPVNEQEELHSLREKLKEQQAVNGALRPATRPPSSGRPNGQAGDGMHPNSGGVAPNNGGHHPNSAGAPPNGGTS